MTRGLVFASGVLFCLAISAHFLYGQDVLAQTQVSMGLHEQKPPEIRHFDDPVLVFFI